MGVSGVMGGDTDGDDTKGEDDLDSFLCGVDSSGVCDKEDGVLGEDGFIGNFHCVCKISS